MTFGLVPGKGHNENKCADVGEAHVKNQLCFQEENTKAKPAPETNTPWLLAPSENDSLGLSLLILCSKRHMHFRMNVLLEVQTAG